MSQKNSSQLLPHSYPKPSLPPIIIVKVWTDHLKAENDDLLEYSKGELVKMACIDSDDSEHSEHDTIEDDDHLHSYDWSTGKDGFYTDTDDDDIEDDDEELSETGTDRVRSGREADLDDVCEIDQNGQSDYSNLNFVNQTHER